MQGYRQEQEDAHVCIPQISKSGIFSKWSFYMVLDGHGGKVPAQIASQKILPKILEQNYSRFGYECFKVSFGLNVLLVKMPFFRTHSKMNQSQRLVNSNLTRQSSQNIIRHIPDANYIQTHCSLQQFERN